VSKIIEVCDYPGVWRFHEGYCYIASSYDKLLSVVDVRAGGVVSTVKLNHDPAQPKFGGMVFSKSGKLFLSNFDNTVSVFEVG
jgi:hypothetical protein